MIPRIPDISNDQRYLPRWKLDRSIHYKIASDPHYHVGRILDLNMAGAQIEMDSRQGITENAPIMIKLHFEEPHQLIIKGKVCWSTSEDHHHRIGVDFELMTEEDQNLLLDHAFELSLEGITKNWYKGWFDPQKNDDGS